MISQPLSVLTLRKRSEAAAAGAFYVYKKNEILFLYQMKVGGCNGLIKGGGFAGIIEVASTRAISLMPVAVLFGPRIWSTNFTNWGLELMGD